MESPKSGAVSAEEADLLNEIDAALSRPESLNDRGLRPRIAIDLCRAAKLDSNAQFAAALRIAESYWNGVATEGELMYQKREIIERGERVRRERGHFSGEWCANQLVLCAVDTSTLPTAYAAEYVVEFARCAGIGIQEIRRAFSAYVPQIAAPR